ncbi:MAG: alkaline phosphatase family protein [Ktedonobacteraceae bacterium]|nr:alkaline phosphatase family protein [Ktedonobacteraceae bacterium]
MFNAHSLNAVNNAKFSQHFVKPLYGSYCFSNIPQTIQFLLTGQGQSALPPDAFGPLPTSYKNVLMFFIDAFGWRFFARYGEKYPLLKTILTQGMVSKMTSQFPSTTAAHVTCINTGLNVGQSGVYEWQYYEPLVDRIITPLLFSYAGDTSPDTLKEANIPAGQFFPHQSIYQALQAHGVSSHVFQHQSYTPSTPSEQFFQGASIHPFKTISEALETASRLLLDKRGTPGYYFFYFDQIDTAGHRYGPDSPQFAEAVDKVWTSLEQLLYKNLQGKVGDTLLMVSADHGQIEVSPETTFYLNRQIPGIERYLRTNQQGKVLVPAGSARDMFLYVKDEHIDEVIGLLQKHLEGRAEVYRAQELIAQHFFGQEKPSSAFLGRVGNVVILPYQGETVWWYEAGVFEMRFLGHHGGLLPEEMEIPLLLLPL